MDEIERGRALDRGELQNELVDKLTGPDPTQWVDRNKVVTELKALPRLHSDRGWLVSDIALSAYIRELEEVRPRPIPLADGTYLERLREDAQHALDQRATYQVDESFWTVIRYLAYRDGSLRV
jgi:hypothetical protein